jgi:NAD(P)H-quinone oxidoreductase subunit 2
MDFSNSSRSVKCWGNILPEGIVIVTLLTVLLGDSDWGRTSSRWTPYGAIAGLLAAILALVTSSGTCH